MHLSLERLVGNEINNSLCPELMPRLTLLLMLSNVKNHSRLLTQKNISHFSCEKALEWLNFGVIPKSHVNDSQEVAVLRTSQKASLKEILASMAPVPDSIGLRQDPRSCISSKLPCYADTLSPGPRFEHDFYRPTQTPRLFSVQVAVLTKRRQRTNNATPGQNKIQPALLQFYSN